MSTTVLAGAGDDAFAAPAPRTSTSGAVLAGAILLLVGVGGFGWWAAVAPLSSAALAPGVVKAQGERKVVQHLEGGVVRNILVEEGAEVRKGQVLLRIDDTEARARLAVLENRWLTLLAKHSRLVAEQEGAETITFAPELLARLDDPKVAQLVAGQEEVFRAQRRSVEGVIEILKQRIAQVEEEIIGLSKLVEAGEQQRVLIVDELASMRTLFEKGYATRARLLALERAAAGIGGEIGQRRAQIARARQSVGELEIRIAEIRDEAERKATQELQDVSASLQETTQELTAIRAVVERTEVVAPVDGTVVGLSVHTVGAVIAPGERLMEIVPADAGAIIEAHVNPDDIEIVRDGLPARVTLTAYNQRQYPDLPAKVTYVSADRFVDERNGASYFVAHIAVDRDALATTGIDLNPGMLAQVMIITGERTFLDYLIEPLSVGISKAFRES